MHKDSRRRLLSCSTTWIAAPAWALPPRPMPAGVSRSTARSTRTSTSTPSCADALLRAEAVRGRAMRRSAAPSRAGARSGSRYSCSSQQKPRVSSTSSTCPVWSRLRTALRGSTRRSRSPTAPPGFAPLLRQRRRRLRPGLLEAGAVSGQEERFLLVGQTEEEGKRRGAAAMDWFVFPAGLFGEVPPFAVGRAGFDNWLVWKARQVGIVVDATHDVRRPPAARLRARDGRHGRGVLRRGGGAEPRARRGKGTSTRSTTRATSSATGS